MGNDHLVHSVSLRAMLTSVAAIAFLTQPVNGDQLEELAKRVGVRVLSEGTSESDVLEFTKSRIPYGKMSAGAQQRAASLLSDVSQYRRMPSLQYAVNPNIYQYLINHPDVAISTWRVMGISRLNMYQTGEFEYEATATDGSEGIADILWRDGNQCLFVVEGKYNSPLLPTAIHASALVWLQYRFVQAEDGTYLVNQQTEAFIHFPSSAIDAIAKVASRVTNTILDRNVFEVSLYARMMSQAAVKEPEWIEELAQRMEGVLPQRRMELVQVSRGQTPTRGRTLPPITASTDNKGRLPLSGEFKAFENSMHALNKHVPLLPSEVKHTPSYGQDIGSTTRLMAKPHQYMPEEARRAIAAQEAKRKRALQYNLYYSNPDAKGVPEFVQPKAVPPSLHGAPRSAVADLMDSPTPLTFSTNVASPTAHGKASHDNLPQAGSAPVAKETRQSASRPINARPVTNSRVISEGSGNQKPVDTTPPIQTKTPPNQNPKPLATLPVPPAN